MSYAALREEYEALRIGPLIWNLLVQVCDRVARSYPPAVFNDGARWEAEGFENLAQEVVLGRLLAENQLEYVFDIATDEDSLARLLSHQAKRVLAHRRSKTVVDRLAPRIRKMAESSVVFGKRSMGRETWLGLVGTSGDLRTLSDGELHRGGDLISSVPRLPSNPTQSRESMVYSAGDLADLLTRLTTEFRWIAMGDVRKILDIVLTAWLPTVLHDYEEHQISGSPVDVEFERTEMRTMIDTLVVDLEDAHLIVLLGKSQGVSDGELALKLRMSRPSVAERKSEVLARVEQGLISQLPEELHAEATRLLLDRATVAAEALS